MFGMSLSRAVTLGVLLVVGPVFAQIDRPQSTTDKKEIECLQGEWKVVGWEEEGATADTTTFQGKKFVIRGSEIAGELRLASKMSFKLDFAKSPKEIDLTARDGWLKGNTEPGIYEIDGQRLRICLGGKTRPKEFATTPASGLLLLTLEKESPAPSVKETKLTVDLAKELLPPAAGISNSDFEKLSEYPRPDVVKSKSLSLVLLTLRPPQKPDAAMDEEFRFLGEQINLSDIVKAMWISKDKGYASFIQPKYITECSCESTTERAEGVVTFKSDLFAGHIPFIAQATKDGWVITEFRLPQHKTKVVRDKDGVWNQEALEGGRMDAQKDGEPILKRFVLKEADVTDLAKVLNSFFEDARIVADPHTKSLLVEADAKTLYRLTTVIELLDKPADAKATFLKQPEQAKVNVAASPKFNDRVFVYRAEPISGTIVGHHGATKEIVLDVGVRDGVRFGHAFQISPPGSTECVGVAKVMELDANRCVAKVVSLDPGHAAKSLKGMTAACTAPKPEKGKAEVERRVVKKVWQTESLENNLIRELLEKGGEGRILIVQEN